MENLNIRDIKHKSGDIAKQNPKIIGIVILYSLLIGGFVSIISNLVPVAGPFIGLFCAIILYSKLIMKLESEIYRDIMPANSIKPFIPIFFKTIFFLVTISILAVVAFLALVPSALSDFNLIGVLKISIGILLLSLLGYTLIPVLYVLPKTYIATKFNDYDKEELKRVWKAAKSRGLTKKILLLEAYLICEIIAASFIGGILVGLAIIIAPIVGIIIYIGIIFATLAINSKFVIAKVILFREITTSGID